MEVFSYGQRLSVNGTTGEVTISQENGSEIIFAPDGSGGYVGPPRVIAELVHDPGGGWDAHPSQARTESDSTRQDA